MSDDTSTIALDQFEASVDLDDEHAHRSVVKDFDDLVLRITGTELEDSADGVDIDLSTLAPRDDAVVELIDGDEVFARLIQDNTEDDNA